MSNDILLNDIREPVLVNIAGSDGEELSLTKGATAVSKSSNGNVVSGSPMNNNEAAKLLDVTDSESESDLNLQFTLPKRKVRFKRKFRAKGSKGKKQGNDGSLSDGNTSCLCRCSEGLGIMAFLVLSVCLALLLWFHYNLSSKVDQIQKQANTIEAQCKETPEALHDYHIQLKFLDSNVSLFGDELKKINSEISAIKKDVEKLKQSSTDIKASIAAAPEIKTLPKDVESLSESVASIGSKISALETLVKDLKEQQSSFSSTTDSIAKQQESLKESLQEVLNATSSNFHQVPDTTTSATPLGSSQKVTDAIAQLNASLVPRMTQVDQMYKYFDILNKSVFAVQNLNNHTHEVVHSLQKYVHENLTVRVSILEEQAAAPLDPSHLKAMEDVLNNKLSQALNCCSTSLHLPYTNTSQPASWESLLSSANRMVGIYLQLYHRVKPNDTFPFLFNDTEDSGLLLNRTLDGLFQAQNTGLQKLHGDLESFAASCKSAIGQIGRNLTIVSRKVEDLSSQIEVPKSERHALETLDAQSGAYSDRKSRYVDTISSPIITTLRKALP